MSLVNEALKKARLEAARQEAARRGVPMPALGGARPRRAGPGWPLAAAAAVLLALGAVLFLAGRRSAVPDPALIAAAPLAPAPATPPVDAPPAAASPATDALPAPAAVPPARRTRDRGADPAPLPPAVSRPEPGPARPAEPEPVPHEPDPPVRIVTAREATPPPAAPPRELAEHVRELPLPGGERLVLGGIAWSEERPFALLNGRVLGAGERIAGLTVVRIEPAGVELRGDPGSFFLRLK